MEQTFALLKPDCIERKLTGKAVDFIINEGFIINQIKKLKMTEKQAKEFYIMHKGKEFYKPLTKFMISGPVIAMILQRNNAIQKFRKVIGSTDPKNAAEGTLRQLYATDVRHNIVHGADSFENFEREASFFFPRIDLIK